ncbi:Uncharacterized membrane protein YczE [Weissella bombi]|uniref:Uncharacterized membrane protein YczE n=2 Tax=Weissella bombi TaxID=1505725 RepID=A0A1C4A7T5_9LACO|nr:Uncharacterized membrane protein YczE [Weissella bombi]
MENHLKEAFRLKNIVTLMMGLMFMAAGVSLSRIAGLGTSPIASIPNVLSYMMPLSIGSLTIIFMIVCVGVEIIFLKKKFSMANLLQIIPGSIFGMLINVFLSIFSFIQVTTYWQKLGLTVISIVVLAFGVYLEVASHSIILPGEGVAKAISIAMNKPFAKAKIWVDSSMVMVALILALVVFHSLTGIREGTVLSALLVGHVVALFKRWFADKV